VGRVGGMGGREDEVHERSLVRGVQHTSETSIHRAKELVLSSTVQYFKISAITTPRK
jgi:hypothetical protein